MPGSRAPALGCPGLPLRALAGALRFALITSERERFVLCRCERRDEHEQVTWRNPNAREAKALFAACTDAGGQRLGERLHTQALW